MLLWYLIVTFAVALNIAAWGGLTYAVVQIARGKTKKSTKQRETAARMLTTPSHRRQRAMSFG